MLIFGDDDPYAPVKPGVTDIHVGDCRSVLSSLPDQSINCCITSPPYLGLRHYGVAGQIGLESSIDDYVQELVNVFRGVWRVLKDDGTLWLNLGDSYARNGGSDQHISASARVGSTRNSMTQRGDRTQTVPNGLKSKDLMMVPARVAIALVEEGWYLRSDIIWEKNNCMPESVTDRPTSSHEHVFLLTKKENYYYDADAIAEPVTSDRVRGPALHPDPISTNGNSGLARRAIGTTRNARNVWHINTVPYKGAHFATMPPELVKRCVLAGTRLGDTVLDPFGGAGTSGLVAQQFGRNAVLIELNPEYAALARQRLQTKTPV